MKSFLEKLYFALIFGELTTTIVRVIGGSDDTNVSTAPTSNPVLLALNALVICSTCYYVFPKLPLLWRALLQLKWVFLLYLWATLSILWSVDGRNSAKYEIYSIVYLFAAIYLAFRYDTNQILNLLERCFLVVAILSVVGEFTLPPPDDLAPGWRGIFLQKNHLGVCMTLAISVLLVQEKRMTLSRACTVVLYGLLLVLSQSFTAVLTTAVILVFLFSNRLATWTRAIFWTLLVGLAGISLIVSNPFELILSAGGKSSNFTGRDVIWAFALKATVERPIIGHGANGAYWKDSSDAAVQALHWNPNHAHNGFIEILLDLGVVGLILTIGFLINTWRRARRIRRNDPTRSSIWTQVLILGALAHNLTETDFLATRILWFLLMVGSFSCLKVELEKMKLSTENASVDLTNADLLTA